MTGPTTDTIAALATPPGRGGIGIVRVSGARAAAIAQRLLGRLPAPRHAEYLPFRAPDHSIIDQGIALYFPAPHSFTGEDVLELQGHGGPVVVDMLLEAVLAAGARAALPGEFSQRAFLNGKLDLAQAEAVADLIDSASRTAARCALRSLQGEFSRRIDTLLEALIGLRTYVESALDFPDEEIDFLGDGAISARLAELSATLAAVVASARQGRLLKDGMTVVLAGRPNAGKSSLLNALAGQETAIVTDVPGTTRDLLREHISIDGMPLHVVDTAGLREATDAVEQEGIRRAWAAIESADRLVLVVDDRIGIAAEELAILARLPPALPRTIVRNKVDLTGTTTTAANGDHGVEIPVSARSGYGIDTLRAHLKSLMGYQGADEGVFMARRRHLAALALAQEHLSAATALLRQGTGELLAEELRLAQNALGEVTGRFTSDDLLERIFSTFCIGK